MIQAKFLFPNFGGKTHMQSLDKSLKISSIRDSVVPQIIQENNYNKDGKAVRARLFHLGSELQEEKTLQEYCKTNGSEGNGEIIIHVFMSNQNAAPKKVEVPADIKKDKPEEEENVCSCNMF